MIAICIIIAMFRVQLATTVFILYKAQKKEIEKAYLLGQLNSNKVVEFNKEIYKLGII